MNQKQLERWAYSKPECKLIKTNTEQFICVSVSMNAPSSTESDWDSETVHNGDHDEWFGTMSEVAPAKKGWFEEEDF